jgi:hypothetical protein
MCSFFQDFQDLESIVMAAACKLPQIFNSGVGTSQRNLHRDT